MKNFEINRVSIQLMSPVSGDYCFNDVEYNLSNDSVSIQLMSPVSGDLPTTTDTTDEEQANRVSIQLMSPVSGDPSILNPYPVKCPETVSEGQEKKW